MTPQPICNPEHCDMIHMWAALQTRHVHIRLFVNRGDSHVTELVTSPGRSQCRGRQLKNARRCFQGICQVNKCCSFKQQTSIINKANTYLIYHVEPGGGCLWFVVILQTEIPAKNRHFGDHFVANAKSPLCCGFPVITSQIHGISKQFLQMLKKTIFGSDWRSFIDLNAVLLELLAHHS